MWMRTSRPQRPTTRPLGVPRALRAPPAPCCCTVPRHCTSSVDCWRGWRTRMRRCEPLGTPLPCRPLPSTDAGACVSRYRFQMDAPRATWQSPRCVSALCAGLPHVLQCFSMGGLVCRCARVWGGGGGGRPWFGRLVRELSHNPTSQPPQCRALEGLLKGGFVTPVPATIFCVALLCGVLRACVLVCPQAGVLWSGGVRERSGCLQQSPVRGLLCPP